MDIYKQTFYQDRHKYDPQVHDKIISITNRQRDANQNHSEITAHFSKIDCYQKSKRSQVKAKILGEEAFHSVDVG